MHRRLWVPVLLSGLMLAAPYASSAQQADIVARDSSAVEQGVLVIESNQPDGRVFVDGNFLGVAGETPLAVPPGTHRVTLVPPTLNSWYQVRPSRQVVVSAGDTLRVVLNMPYVYRIASTPYDAHVYLETPEGQVALGATPLLLRREEPIRSDLVVRKEGYRPERIAPGDALVNKHEVALSPLVLDESEGPATSWRPERRSRRWITFAAGGLALASGALAVHYKTKADRLFDEYDRTGDPDLRPDIERFDTYAAVALGTMQVGVGVLGVRLIIR